MINPVEIFFKTIGGLGIFIYGMNILSEGLQKIAGKKLKDILNLLTKNRFIGVVIGVIITSIVQSSSTVTVMVVGFVNAGLLSLEKAISVIIGSNIGTTVTAQLIAFNVAKYALPAIAIGVLMSMFSKKRSHQYIGQTILGFGFLFFGLNIMSDAFVFLKQDPTFHKMFILFSHNMFAAVTAGAVLTMIIQSSSAAIGIIQTLAVVGAIDFIAAVPLVFGSNIGTTITAQISSIGTSRNARRAAWAHTMFNVLGVVFFLLLYIYKYQGVPVYLWFVNQITPGDVFANNANISRHIANAHTFFNVINVLIFIPLIGILARVTRSIIPGEDDTLQMGAKYLDKRIIKVPTIALEQAQKELLYMMDISRKMIPLSLAGVFNPEKHRIKKVMEMEKVVDNLQEEIIDFLVSLESNELSEGQATQHNCLLHLVNDVEKIADYAQNIAYLVENKIEDKIIFSKDAELELKEMLQDVLEECELSVRSFEKNDLDLALKAFELEGRIDQRKDDCRKNHLIRLKARSCNLNSGAPFTDIVNNLERISDSAVKFAKWRENPKLFL